MTAGRRLLPPEHRRMSTPELLRWIVDQHRGDLRSLVPVVASRADKVARVHRLRAPGLTALAAAVHDLTDVLAPHLDHEDQVLFPALARGCAVSGTTADELRDLRRDHLQLVTLLERIRDRSDGFTVPAWGCRSYRALAGELAGLDRDLRAHVHLEDHHLFPRFA
jgi:regulator of cell morphogenesis and NO signaling